jgi:hypothetical protein
LALAGLPGSTTAALAMAAGVGRSTAAKVLARWDLDGTAIRATGDGPRTPDTWTLAQPDYAAPAPDTIGMPKDTAATATSPPAMIFRSGTSQLTAPPVAWIPCVFGVGHRS